MNPDSQASEPSTAALCIARWGILRNAKTYLNSSRGNEATIHVSFTASIQTKHFFRLEPSLAVDGADPLEDALPHLRVEQRLRGQAVEHVVPRLQRLPGWQ